MWGLSFLLNYKVNIFSLVLDSWLFKTSNLKTSLGLLKIVKVIFHYLMTHDSLNWLTRTRIVNKLNKCCSPRRNSYFVSRWHFWLSVLAFWLMFCFGTKSPVPLTFKDTPPPPPYSFSKNINLHGDAASNGVSLLNIDSVILLFVLGGSWSACCARSLAANYGTKKLT